ncbi:hypothetical protein CMI37_25005 [Candidatus Pacearchaeota archaeon]|nr:hypothetical protein [Candidatus Pacearchaeota archaeon]|tara:strand:- start:926 stop:1105 length:180 start_codon:yes stop_codon:yes gene_type:complete
MSKEGQIARGEKYSARIAKGLPLPQQVDAKTNADILAYNNSLTEKPDITTKSHKKSKGG